MGCRLKAERGNEKITARRIQKSECLDIFDRIYKINRIDEKRRRPDEFDNEDSGFHQKIL